MKKLIMLSGVMAITLLASCKDKKETPPPTPPAVEDPAPPPAPEPAVQQESNDGTSVKINEDGVSIKNKEGDNESNVTITDDKKEVNIKTH